MFGSLAGAVVFESFESLESLASLLDSVFFSVLPAVLTFFAFTDWLAGGKFF